MRTFESSDDRRGIPATVATALVLGIAACTPETPLPTPTETATDSNQFPVCEIKATIADGVVVINPDISNAFRPGEFEVTGIVYNFGDGNIEHDGDTQGTTHVYTEPGFFPIRGDMVLDVAPGVDPTPAGTIPCTPTVIQIPEAE